MFFLGAILLLLQAAGLLRNLSLLSSNAEECSVTLTDTIEFAAQASAVAAL